MSEKLDLLKSVFGLNLAGTLSFDDSRTIAFEHAVKIYLNKPQVVNKWLAGSITTDPFKLDSDFPQFDSEYKEFLSKNNAIFNNVKYCVLTDFVDANLVLFIPFKDVLDTLKYASINFPHMFHYDKSGQKIDLYTPDNGSDLQVKWLKDQLLPKLKNWSLAVDFKDGTFSCAKLNTLTLYPEMVNDYSKLYQDLKSVYYPKFSSNWLELTNTNPEKFIHEDISIACYFILVWKHLGLRPMSFVDLGCGNGLLVHILNNQGYKGYGVDMRRRKIWDHLSNTRLIESTIDPRNDTYEDCDWLIGNHSDELSPWLPYISFKTSQKSRIPCNVILIPCCFFDFNSKFEAKSSKDSRYDTYLNYLEGIFNSFNLKTRRDKLRIPSTKNVCLIGIMEEVKMGDSNEILEKLSNTGFVARDLEAEKMKSSRNCTKNVDRDLRVLIVKKVLEHLLEEKRVIEKYDGSKWNSGRSCSVTEIAGLFDKDILSKIKSECGGIKTLIKNYHQLFICERDMVRLRNQITDVRKKDTKIYEKTKTCMFYLYHPDGCFLSDNDCLFLHEIKS